MAFGCLYTVRDVGFADIGSVPYRLYYYVRDDTPAELVSTFRQISYATLMDSNVKAEVINVDQQGTHPDSEGNNTYDQPMKYLDFWEVQSFPAAILVSPQGRSLVLPISASDQSFKEAVWSALDEIVISPERKEILSSIIKKYCAVLFVEGTDAAANEKARKTVEDAIEELSEIMTQMPKAIEKPPRLIVMSPESFSRERTLLWSLGVGEDAEARREPHAAVIYGRGRRIGSLLRGEKITVNEVFNVLSVIGESCECGIDRDWLLGLMLPLRWNQETQSETAKSLGFDVEDPMVKTEISQILSRGTSSGIVSGNSLRSGTGESTSPLAGYSETVVEFEGGPARSAVSPAQFRQLVSPEAATTGTDAYAGSAFRPYLITIFIIGGAVLLILAGGILVLLRARRRAL
jgi:hypothetical protein